MTTCLQTLRSSYSILLSELRRIEDSSSKVELPGATKQDGSIDTMLEKLIGHLCGQLAHYLTARTKTMDLYPFVFNHFVC